MGGPPSVTFSDTYVVKIGNVIAIRSKPLFYQKLVDDIYSGRKIGNNDLFRRLNNYHPSTELAIELNPNRFLDTKLTGKVQNYHHYEPLKLQTVISKIQLMAIFIVQKRISSNFDKEIPLMKENFKKADYPLRFINTVINELWVKIIKMKVL